MENGISAGVAIPVKKGAGDPWGSAVRATTVVAMQSHCGSEGVRERDPRVAAVQVAARSARQSTQLKNHEARTRRDEAQTRYFETWAQTLEARPPQEFKRGPPHGRTKNGTF